MVEILWLARTRLRAQTKAWWGLPFLCCLSTWKPNRAIGWVMLSWLIEECVLGQLTTFAPGEQSCNHLIIQVPRQDHPNQINRWPSSDVGYVWHPYLLSHCPQWAVALSPAVWGEPPDPSPQELQARTRLGWSSPCWRAVPPAAVAGSAGYE